MHNQLKFIFLILFFFTFEKKHFAQDCEVPEVFKNLEGNNIFAKISLNGTLFQDYPLGAFNLNTYQYPSDISTIGNFNLWLGAIGSNGQHQIAANRFPSDWNNDFVSGPIINENGQLNFECENFSQLWEVFGTEIKEHIADFEDDGTIDNPIQNIYAYPAHQNPFFEDIHGFSLPNTIHGLAPFFDNNNDGIYNPENGDFPLPDSVDPSIIPGHIIWGIFNDGGTNHTNSGGLPLNAEIHQTLWSFYCDGNEHLNNSIFTSYKIINKGNTSLDSMFVTFETDPNLGCPFDDHFGSIPDLNTFYFYNRDQIDGYDSLGYCGDYIPTFGNNPPVQAISFLNKEMSSFIYHFSPIGSGPITPPNSPHDYYTYMNGWWQGNIPLTIGGVGYGGTQITSFAFSDHPDDSLGWSMHQSNFTLDPELNTLSNTYIGLLQPNESTTVDLAFTFYSDETLNHIETVDLVYDNTPLIQQAYDTQFANDCIPYSCTNDCVWAGDADKDSIVTTFDFLQIGLTLGATGTIRAHPLIWQPFESQNWNSSFLNTDLKHTDCNGNGQIDTVDFQEPVINFGKSYKVIPPVDVYNNGPELSIYLESNIDTLFIIGGIQPLRVKLNQEEQIAGLAFTIEGDTSMVNLIFGFARACWAPNQTDPIHIYQFGLLDQEENEFHYSSVKIDGENSLNRNDNILTFIASPKDTSYQLIQTTLRIKNIRAILADGTILDYGSQDFLLNIVNPNGEGIVLENQNLEEVTIQVFPNPTTDILNIKMENPTPSHITIFNIYGKKVFEKMDVNQSEIQVSTSHFSQGVYFLKIEIEGKEFVQKFLKM